MANGSWPWGAKRSESNNNKNKNKREATQHKMPFKQHGNYAQCEYQHKPKCVCESVCVCVRAPVCVCENLLAAAAAFCSFFFGV